MPEFSAETALGNINTNSKPSQLKITDIRFATIVGAPMRCPLIKVYTNQGIVGYGEVRDWATKTYALTLKSRLIGENPCDVDRLFRRIKQFGGQSRQGGGVSGLEIALWDLAGKAYGVPIYQMLGGKFRDKVRCYCDTDVRGKDTARWARRSRSAWRWASPSSRWTSASARSPTSRTASRRRSACWKYMNSVRGAKRRVDTPEFRAAYFKEVEAYGVAHPFTGIHITEKGLDAIEDYVDRPRDHRLRSSAGRRPLRPPRRRGRDQVRPRVEKYNLAWLEDLIPWQYTDQYVRLSQSTTTPICTGEDIYLKENFRPLLEKRGVSVIHPDILSTGGILETKKIGDLAQEHGVAMAMHMAESPIAAMACAHVGVATENFYVLENHSIDVPWWSDMVTGLPKPLIQDGFITVPDKPGLGIDDLVDDVIREHLDPNEPGLWESTDQFNNDWSNDRTWS